MKIADVKIGETYLTRVSGSLVRVVATARVEPTCLYAKTARFRVRRVDNGKVLDKTRAASALRPLPVSGTDPVTQALREQLVVARLLESEGRWAEALATWNALAKAAAEAGRLKTVAFAEARAEIALAKSNAATADPEGTK